MEPFILFEPKKSPAWEDSQAGDKMRMEPHSEKNKIFVGGLRLFSGLR
jgi:hypothetical protein